MKGHRIPKIDKMQDNKMNRPCRILFTSVGRRVELMRLFRRAFERLGVNGQLLATDVNPLATGSSGSRRAAVGSPL